MELDFNEFKARLLNEMTRGIHPAHYIQEEVRRAEALKLGLVEEVERAPQFVTEASNKIDSYLYQLHELAKKYPLDFYQLDQKTAIQDDKMQQGIKDQLKKLDETEDPEGPGKIHPLDLS